MPDRATEAGPHPSPLPISGEGAASLPSPAGGRGIGGEGKTTVLLLGGTAEAAALARRLAADPSIKLIVSFAGRVAQLPDLPGDIRIGGFGGVEGLADFLINEEVSKVIDATHPFAAAISAQVPAAVFTGPASAGNLASFTLTLNFKPTRNLKIQPEVRYNTTSYTGGLNGSHNQFIVGCGATYLF